MTLNAVDEINSGYCLKRKKKKKKSKLVYTESYVKVGGMAF